MEFFRIGLVLSREKEFQCHGSLHLISRMSCPYPSSWLPFSLQLGFQFRNQERIMDRLPDLICPKHMIPPTNQQLTHSPIPHTGQIRNLSVIINILHLLVSKIWTLRLKFQNVTKIGGFNPYYFTTELLQLLCNWSPYFLSIPLQFILNVFPGKKKIE